MCLPLSAPKGQIYVSMQVESVKKQKAFQHFDYYRQKTDLWPDKFNSIQNNAAQVFRPSNK